MKTLSSILKLQPDINRLYLRIKNEPYMTLVIESLTEGPVGQVDISVAHYFIQNGDSCQDPEMCFHVTKVGDEYQFEPFMFQQAVPPVYQEVDNTPAGVLLKKQLKRFAALWDDNLGKQGFLEAALKMVGK